MLRGAARTAGALTHPPAAGGRIVAAMKTLLPLLAAVALSACTILGPARDVVPTIKVPGSDPGQALVVVLPGIATDEEDLRDEGVAAAIQRGWPEADVLLVGATFQYYRTGVMVPRLRDAIVKARAEGYREIWLAGGSMGGLGVLLYEWHYPGELTGLVLMSPFLGDDVPEQVREVGLERWQPGPLAPKMDGDNFEQHVWSMIKGWRQRPELGRRAWLVCGTEDRLFEDVQLLAPEIAQGQYLPGPGGHDWAYWIPAAESTFRRIAEQRRLAAAAR